MGDNMNKRLLIGFLSIFLMMGIAQADILDDIWNGLLGLLGMGDSLILSENSLPPGTYTPSTETHCDGTSCTLSLYSGTMYVYEDDTWKRTQDAKSLIDSWLPYYREKGVNFDINVSELNYTHIKGYLKVDDRMLGQVIPFQYCSISQDICNKAQVLFNQKEKEFDLVFQKPVLDYNFTLGIDPKETWGTTDAVHNIDGDVTSTVDSDDGMASDLFGKNDEYIDLLAWNDTVPVGYMFHGINVTVDVQNVDGKWGLSIQHNRTGSYVTECSWADVDDLNPLICQFDTTDWWTQDVNGLGVRLLSTNTQHGEVDYVYMTVDYANPTTIMLQDADSENLDDTMIQNYYGATDREFGACALMYMGAEYFSEIRYHPIVKINITVIPSGQQIDESQLHVYATANTIDSGESFVFGSHHIYAFPAYNITNEWTEGNGICTGAVHADPEISWDDRPTTSEEWNSTAESAFTVDDTTATSAWHNWTVTNMVQTAYSNGDGNISIWLKGSSYGGSPSGTDFISFDSKEGATASQRPYLNITYSEEAGDTCDCSSLQAGTEVDCSENCDIEACDTEGEDITFVNSGVIEILGDVTGFRPEFVHFSQGCVVIIEQGKKFG